MKVEKLNLRHLRGFGQVAITGSVTEGARLVNMSQPALTQAIAKLEVQVGEKLFVRDNNGLFLTPAGTVFKNRTEKAFQHLSLGIKASIAKAGRSCSKNHSFENLITMTQLRSLLAVAEAQNFSLAARRSGLTQPSIYRAAKELEHIAGNKFYEKNRHGINLTRPAIVLADHVRLMFTLLRYGLEEIKALSGAETGQIAVGTLPFARSNLLPRAINRFLVEHPNIDFDVQDGLYSDLLRKLRTGELDILVGALREMPPTDDVHQQMLFDDRLAIISRVGHPLVSKKGLKWSDLAAYRWVVPRSGTPTRKYFDKMMSETGHFSKINVIETSSLVMIRGLLVDSDSLTISSLIQIETEEKLGLLAKLDFDLHGAERRIGLTTRRDWAPTKLRKKFYELLQSEGSAMGVSL